jgi:hypothetical protein
MLVQLPNGSDGLPTDVGVLHCHGIRGSKLALDAVVSGLFGVSSSPSSHEVALRRAENGKKYSEGVRSRPDIHFIPIEVTEYGTLGGHATVFFDVCRALLDSVIRLSLLPFCVLSLFPCPCS